MKRQQQLLYSTGRSSKNEEEEEDEEEEEEMYFQSEVNVGGIDSPRSPQKYGRGGPESDTCFRCRKLGHWAVNCPEKSSPSKPKQQQDTPIIITTDSQFPYPLRCRCGFGHCLLRTSHTSANPGRKFFACPGTTGRNCAHFKWCDRVTMAEINNPPQYRFPECNCGVGTCHLVILKSGPNAGRQCFVCSIPKGDGACSFSQLFDARRDIVVNGQAESKSFSSPLSTLENRSSSDLVEDGDVSSKHLKKRYFESPVMDNPQHSPSPVDVPLKRNKVLLSDGKEHDENSAICSPKLSDPPIDGVAANTSSVPNYTNNLVLSQVNLCDSLIKNTRKSTLLPSQADIHCRQTYFWRQISYAGATSFEGSVSQGLGLHVVWLGQIAFSPSRCLTNPSYKPFFCCVFPNFDPIHLLKDADTLETESSDIPPHCPLLAEAEKSDALFPSTPRQDAQISSGIFRDGGFEQANLMNVSISKAFRQAAWSVQNDLLNLLDSMDILDHEDMMREAKLVFDALDSLGVDNTPFRERVLEFIGCASSLASIEEWSICEDLSSQELLGRYDHEKDHFASLSCSHAEAMTAFTASKERRQSLHEEASSLKDKLFQIENQLSACETETMHLENHLVEISEEVSMSQQSLQAASQEAEEASKLHEQREAERRTAKAALEKAKLQLRQ